MPHIDLTSVWIPGGLIGILVLIMIRLFINERRSASALAAGASSAAPVEVTMPAPATAPAKDTPDAVEPPPMADKPAEAEKAASVSEPEKAPVAETKNEEQKPEAKPKGSLVWRTAWIWLPFFAGFLGQAYLDIFKPIIEPLIEKSAG